jgi:type III secretory pathway lipoprotein EscJ
MKNFFLIICLSLLTLTSCKEVILHDLSETKANKVCVILNEYKITADKVKAGNNWNIQTPTKDVFNALRILDKSRFLKRDSLKIKAESKGFMASKDERQKALERELAMNLEETLEAIPEILEARLHFYFSAPNDFDLLLEPKQKSASVLLVVNSQVDANDDNLKTIVTQLISGAAGVEERGINIIVAKDFIDNDNFIWTAKTSATGAGDILGLELAPIFLNKIFLISSLSFLGFLILSYCIRRKRGKAKEQSDSQKITTEQAADKVKAQVIVAESPKTVVSPEEKKINNLGKFKPFRYLNQGLF